jgi:DNA mismatch endonuclease (patch repair protein)
MPKDRSEYWRAKFARNIERDAAAIKELEKAGWRVLVVWQCQTKDTRSLNETLRTFLQGPDVSAN